MPYFQRLLLDDSHPRIKKLLINESGCPSCCHVGVSRGGGDRKVSLEKADLEPGDKLANGYQILLRRLIRHTDENSRARPVDDTS